MTFFPRQTAQRSFRRVVRKTDTPVFEEAGEGRPTGEHVIDGFGDAIVPGELGAFGAQPLFERGDERRAP